MATSKQPGEGRTVTFDDPVMIMMMIAMVGIAGWATWYFLHTYIAAVYAYWRYIQFYLFHLIGEAIDVPGISIIHDWIGGLCAPDGAIGACQRDFSTVLWSEVADSSAWVNGLLLLCLVGYCIKLGIRANATHPKIRFSKAHTIKSFVDEQKHAVDPKTGKLLYPHLRLFAELDLIAEPLDHPMFGMSETSRQFMAKHRLVTDWRAEPGGFWAPTIDRKRATEVFRQQLGQHWTSSVNLSPGETLLVAIAMPRVAATNPDLDDKDFKAAMEESDRMVRYCWDQFVPPPKTKKGKTAPGEPPEDPYAWLKPTIDLTMPRELIKKYIGHEAVQVIIEHHAFNRTVICALYLQARRLGVLQPAEMRWLRFFDRQLWYVLENIGRMAGYAEAAGVLSHLLYEARSGQSIAEPQLDKVVNGLEMAVNNFKFTDADKERYRAAGAPALPVVDKK